MTRLLIFTTGTSLFENLLDTQKEFRQAALVESFPYRGDDAWARVLRLASGNGLRTTLVQFGKLYSWLDLADDYQRTRATAEMAGLHLLQPQANDNLVFLCSDTGEGAFSALVNAMLLGKEVKYPDRAGKLLMIPGFAETEVEFHTTLNGIRRTCVELRVVEGLNPKPPGNFVDEAIPRMVSEIAGLHYNRAAGVQTVLNYTAGFKAAIPTLTQVAAVAGSIQLVCLYEDAAELVRQPLIHIDLKTEDRQRLLSAGTGSADDVLHKYGSPRLLPRAEEAFYKAAAGDRLALSSLGKAMQELLQAERRAATKQT